MKENPSYNFSADFIRALAIVAVVTIHVFSEFVNTPKFFGSANWWFANTVDAAMRVAVPLFVMLSGMLLLHSEKNYSAQTFFKKRFSKIGIPLIVWPILYYSWSLHIHHKQFILSSFISNFISLNIYYHLYYLYLIAGLYLLTPMLKVFLNNGTAASKKYALIITLLFSFLITAAHFFLDAGPNLATIFTIALPYVGFYLAGDYFRDMKFTKKQIRIFIFSYVVLTILTAVLNFLYMHLIGWNIHTTRTNGNYDRYFYEYFSFNITAMSLIAFVLLRNFENHTTLAQKVIPMKIIKQLAKTAFGIYLIHPFLLDVFNRYLLIDPASLHIPLTVFLILKTATVFLVAYFVVALASRVKLLKVVFG